MHTNNTLTLFMLACMEAAAFSGNSLRLTLAAFYRGQSVTLKTLKKNTNNEVTILKKCRENFVVGVMTWFVELVELSMTRVPTLI